MAAARCFLTSAVFAQFGPVVGTAPPVSRVACVGVLVGWPSQAAGLAPMRAGAYSVFGERVRFPVTA